MEVERDLDGLRRGDIAEAGGKGANLGELIGAGVPVPPGFVLTTAAYRRFVDQHHVDLDAPPAQIRDQLTRGELPDDLRQPLLGAYAALGSGPVAVRSSATAEDLAEASFAGQQESFLNVTGVDDLLSAVRGCWASLWGDRAVEYRRRRDVDPGGIALAVVVQTMVEADAAGVLFTANPETGSRDETVIAAAWGLGESVVGGTVDPDQLVVADGVVRSRRTADKAVMTVYAGTGTQEVPVPAERRRAPVLDDAAAVELAAIGRRVAEHFGAPQDLEWVRAGERFSIVQSRPITALPEPVGTVPQDWPVPDSDSFYFRASIVEQLPDPLTPLFADLAEAAVPRSLQQMVAEFSGRDLVSPGQVGFPTINGYAYYRYSRAGMAKMLLATPALLRWMVTSGSASLVARWRDVAHPRYGATVEHWRAVDPATLSVPQLLGGITELVDAATRYYTSVQTIIPLAATSEVLLTRCYELLVRRPGDPPAATLLLGFDSAPICADKSLHDLAGWVRSRPGLAEALSAGTTADLAEADPHDPPAGVEAADWAGWCARFGEHLARYGHTVYNLDPVNPVPADDPVPVLAAIRHAISGAAADPYARQAASVQRREQLSEQIAGRLDPIRGRLFGALLGWAQAAGPVREDALADVGLGWPRLRALARELGNRLVAAGTLDHPDDVYWLRPTEIERVGHSTTLLTAVVARRRERWRGQRRANPPQMLPQLWWSGWLDSMMPAASLTQTGDEIRGLAGSAGQVRGVARVLAGPQDFDRLQPGEILVASITTPAWTPLFAVAAGVVTDIGGPLSHSSIVAREYGIPAVLGTGVATRQIADGARIEVDGDRGRVRKLDS